MRGLSLEITGLLRKVRLKDLKSVNDLRGKNGYNMIQLPPSRVLAFPLRSDPVAWCLACRCQWVEPRLKNGDKH